MDWVLVDVAPKSNSDGPGSVSDGPGSGFRPRAVVLFRIDDLFDCSRTDEWVLFVRFRGVDREKMTRL